MQALCNNYKPSDFAVHQNPNATDKELMAAKLISKKALGAVNYNHGKMWKMKCDESKEVIFGTRRLYLEPRGWVGNLEVGLVT